MGRLGSDDPIPAELRRMLEDIGQEVRYTREYIGLEALSEPVLTAMAAVPRHLFVPEAPLERAYDNGPLPIGHGQTISQPYIVALMTDLLRLTPDAVVLEVGTGSGYQTAVLSCLVRQVYSVEIVAALARVAAERLHRLGYNNIELRTGDGYAGWPERAPFDGIIVTAATPHIPPPLLEQLRPGARLVIPLGERHGPQMLTVVEKDSEGVLQRREVLPVAFVPLTRRGPQEE